MSNEFLDALADLGVDLDDDLQAGAPPPKEIPAEERFACQRCASTGIYQGRRVYQDEQKCFACQGRGWSTAKDRTRAKARASQKVARETKLAADIEAFREANPGLAEFLAANQWSDFLSEMLAKFHRYGSLTENQIRAVWQTHDRLKARVEAQKAERQAAATPVDLTTIAAMFAKARDAGLKRLAYRAEGLVISPAPASGRNAGSLYVKRAGDGTYLGKVASNAFQCTREATDKDREALNAIAANPAEAATRYGRETGTCACCGRELTDKESIRLGIGPVCAEKWF